MESNTERRQSGATVPPTLQLMSAMDVRNQRLTLLCALLAMALLLALAGWRFYPIKAVEPVYVRDDGTGSLQPLAAKAATDFKADQKHISHHLQHWVRQVQTINPELTRAYLQTANELVVGTAVRELRDHVIKEGVRERMERDANLRRTVDIRSVAFPTPNAAIVFFTQTERTGGAEPRAQRKAMTINFTFVPVETRAEIERNPLGLRVSHFELADDQATQ